MMSAVDRIPGQVLQACRLVLERSPEHARISVAVTSANRGDGKTIVSEGLARVLVRELDRPVIILAPEAADTLEAATSSQQMAADQSLDDVTWIEDRCGVLAVSFDASDERASRLTDLVAAAHHAGFDVVGDLPPIGTPWAEEALRSFSVSVLVVRAGRTRIEDARRALSHMPGGSVAVLNRTGSVVPRFVTRWLGG